MLSFPNFFFENIDAKQNLKLILFYLQEPNKLAFFFTNYQYIIK